MAITAADVGLFICAILLPPLAVFLQHGCFDKDFIIALLLTIIGWIPGAVYAIYKIVTGSPNDNPSLRDPLVQV
ncbi:hypothetical protein WJX74_007758 [Apatococcus lobatus]|uniref:Uncharacterized protein n=1 Tax=Apatococcus lobatus TaxID=904363 RepID=A0AAW1QJ98_9CHLO